MLNSKLSWYKKKITTFGNNIDNISVKRFNGLELKKNIKIWEFGKVKVPKQEKGQKRGKGKKKLNSKQVGRKCS